MRKIWIEFLMEFKGLRIYKVQLLINLLLIPFSYVLIIILAGGAGEEAISYLSSGLIVASLIGSFVGLLAMRISNLTQPQIMELYAAMPVSRSQVLYGLIITYVLLALPQILLLLGLSFWQAQSSRVGFVIIGILISCAAFVALALFLGAMVRNPFKAQGVFPLVSWLLLLFSPIYYHSQHLPAFYKGLMLANPATHALNIIRPFLGFSMIIDVKYSYLYLSIFTITAFLYSYHIIKHKMYLLEKFF